LSIISFFIDFVVHLDVHLGAMIASYGGLTYAIIFLIVFVETGLVFFPFLPGDSLLFVAGAFAALGDLNVFLLIALLSLAAIIGDTSNYWIGRYLEKRLLENRNLRVSQTLIERTRQFFAKHGGKTIVLARFVPGIRTFAPFVAGAGSMNYGRFLTYNIAGGIGWVTIGVLAGFFFGSVPVVKNNFTLFLLGIVVVSFVPAAFALIRAKKARSRSKSRSST
jgi:membrane-associated protein